MSLSLGNILLHFVYLNIIMEPTGRPWKKDAKIEKGNRKQEGGHFTRKVTMFSCRKFNNKCAI